MRSPKYINELARTLRRRTECSPELFGIPAIDHREAEEVIKIALKVGGQLPFVQVNEQLQNEITCQVLRSRGHEEYANVFSMVGIPVESLVDTITGNGFERHENANLQNNAETSHKKGADDLFKKFYLKLLPPKIKAMHEKGDLHIHDLEYFGTRPFCFDWDLRYFLYYGLMPDGNGTKASVSGPAMHPEVAVLHAVKALGSAQTNFAGGQGYYNFLTFLAPYFRNLPYPRIKQLMQMFVFEMTQMMVARGGQLVFSSVQLSPGVPALWKDKPVVAFGKIYDGKKSLERWVYGDLEAEVRLMFMALMDVLLKGDYWKKPFNFPKPEVVLDREFIENGALDEAFYKEGFNNHNLGIYEVCRIPTYRELYQLAFRLAAETGAPYFDNCLPDYRRPGGGEGISCYQCCSYRFSTSVDADPDFRDKLVFKDGAHFSMGSWQVVTINLPRTAYNATPTQCMERIKTLMKDSLQIFKAKAFWMEKMRANNRMPFITQKPHDPNCVAIKGPEAADLSRLAYTFGIVGLEECVQALTGEKMEESENAWEMGLTIVSEMETYLKELEEESGFTLALARTPAETVAGRFAVLDLLNEDIVFQAMDVIKGDVPGTLAKITQGDKSLDQPVYYTNGTHLPVSAKVSIGKKAEMEGAFFPILSGGNIMHIFLGEELPNAEALMNFALKLARDTPVGYFCFTRDFTICLECDRISAGLKERCGLCSSDKVDHISRVTGYAQAVSGWNRAKRQELKDRMRYKL